MPMIPERKKWLSEVPSSIRNQAMLYDVVGKVNLIRSNELDEDEWLWAVVADQDKEFWMNAFDDEAKARNFCQVMNWDIVD